MICRSLFVLLACAGAFALASTVPAGAAQKPEEVKAEEPGMKAPREEVLQWTSDEDKPYWYRLPEEIDEDEPPALLIMLHGTGVPHGWAFWNYPIEDGKFRPHDIVVAPEGMTPGHGDTFNFVQNEQDGDHIAGLVEDFRERFPIDRVYLYGHSQGGFFCYWFAGEYPDHVDGIVAHAGNVLSVRHPKEARQNVAIGILHTVVDPVVGVECAYRSHEIYRNEEYRKLKTWVVEEGIGEHAGHWPLPPHVGTMLAWLDKVCTRDPERALDFWEAECEAEEPDLAYLVQSLAWLEDLIDDGGGKGKDKLEERLAEAREVITEIRDAHIAALEDAIEDLDDDTPFGPWAAHFAEVDHLFADDKVWQKAMKPARKRADDHDDAIADAIEGLYVDNEKAFLEAVEALEECFLSRRARELEVRLLRRAEKELRDVEAADKQRVRDLVAARAGARKEGRAEALEVTRKAAD